MRRVIFVSIVVFIWVLQGCNALINPVHNMVIKDSNGNILLNSSGEFDFGDVKVNTPVIETFTIENLSPTSLILNGSPMIDITGYGKTSFQIVESPTSPIKSKQSTSFKIQFTPTESKFYSVIISISNNIKEVNPYTFTIKGSSGAPKIQIIQDVTKIPSIYGKYEFGNVLYGSSSPEIPFTIANYGSSTLHLTGTPTIDIIGADSTSFIVKQDNVSFDIEAGKSTEFTITYKPNSNGFHNAIISIESNDDSNSPYTFFIVGNSTTGTEINVQDLYANDIPNGKGSFDFGSYTIQSSLSKIFIIQNIGNADLVLMGNPRIEINGIDPSAFTVVAEPSSPIKSNYSTSFTIEFQPTDERSYSAKVVIPNNDTDENPYTFTITGEGIAPDISVLDSDNKLITNGTGDYEFEKTYVNSAFEASFAIKNEGLGKLILSGSPLISITGPGASAFSVSAQPDSIVDSIKDTTFTIRFYPTTYQLYEATVSISNNDPVDNPYVFSIEGWGKYSEYLWTKRIGGVGDDEGRSIFTDDAGNAYLTGMFNGTVNFSADFGGSDVRTAHSYRDIFITKINFNGSYGWTRTFGSNSMDWGNSITVDNSGNVYATGAFFYTVNFGADFGVVDYQTSLGEADIFVMKINSNGSYGWTKRIGGDQWDCGYAITTDSFGNVYLTGSFETEGTSLNFGASFGVSDYKTSVGKKDIFITKINSDGSYSITKKIGSTNNDEGKAITTDSDDNIIITGTYVAQTDFGADFGTSEIKQGCGGDNLFVTKINYDMSYGWTKKICGGNQERGFGVITDYSDSIIITGLFGNGSVNFEADFGGSDIKTTSGSGGVYDIFVTKISRNGGYRWTRQIGGNSDDRGHSIAVDNNRDIYITGWFWSSVDFAKDLYSSDTKISNGYSDIYITKISEHGSYRWTKQIGGAGGDSGNCLTIDKFGNLFVTGSFGEYKGGAVDFGKDFGVSQTKTSAGLEDVFITKIYIN